MNCARQNAPLGLVEADLFRASDFLFPQGLDHHHLLTGSRVLGRVALEVARRLAGLGELPDTARRVVRGTLRRAPLVVIGAGPAGLAAARAAGPGVLLLEREPRPGGAALLGIDPAAPDQDWVAQQARELEGELLLGAECVGLYPNDTPVPGNALLAVRLREGLQAIIADRVIVATRGASRSAQIGPRRRTWPSSRPPRGARWEIRCARWTPGASAFAAMRWPSPWLPRRCTSWPLPSGPGRAGWASCTAFPSRSTPRAAPACRGCSPPGAPRGRAERARRRRARRREGRPRDEPLARQSHRLRLRGRDRPRRRGGHRARLRGHRKPQALHRPRHRPLPGKELPGGRHAHLRFPKSRAARGAGAVPRPAAVRAHAPRRIRRSPRRRRRTSGRRTALPAAAHVGPGPAPAPAPD